MKTKLSGSIGTISEKINKIANAIYEFIERQAKLVNMNPILYMIMLFILGFTLVYVLWLSKYYRVAVEHYTDDVEEEDEEEEEGEEEVEEDEDTEDKRPVELKRPRVYKRPPPKRQRLITKRALLNDNTPVVPTNSKPRPLTKQSFVGRIVEKFLAYLP